MSEIKDTQKFDLSEYYRKFIEEYNIPIEKLTRKQTAEVFKQAILAQDFVRYVQQDGSAQGVSYIPFQGMDRLKSEVLRLTKALELVHSKISATDCELQLNGTPSISYERTWLSEAKTIIGEALTALEDK